MHKKILCLIIILLFGFFAVPVVNASELTASDYGVSYKLDNATTETQKKASCESVFGDPSDTDSFAYYLKQILRLIQFLGPLLCAVLTVIEFVKAVASQDKELLSKASKKTVIRIVLALILFFVPLIVDLLFDNVLGWYGTCGIE